jgi:hypothetical protein
MAVASQKLNCESQAGSGACFWFDPRVLYQAGSPADRLQANWQSDSIRIQHHTPSAILYVCFQGFTLPAHFPVRVT